MEQNTIFLNNFCDHFFSQVDKEKSSAELLKFSSNYKDFQESYFKFMEEDSNHAERVSKMGPFMRNDLSVVINFLSESVSYSEDSPNTLESLLEELQSIPSEEESVIEIINPFRAFEKSYRKFFDLSTTLRVSRYV